MRTHDLLRTHMANLHHEKYHQAKEHLPFDIFLIHIKRPQISHKEKWET